MGLGLPWWGVSESLRQRQHKTAPPYNPLIFVDPSGKYGVVIYDSYPYEENMTKDI